MRRLRWMIARSPLGWPGAVALGLMAIAVAAQMTVMPSMQARLDAIAERPLRAAGAAARDDSPASRLERFYRHFREADPVPDQLAKMHRIAVSHGLTLRQGEYRLADEADGRLRRYQITLPVAGPYPAVRAFLADTLDQLPTAALEHVAFERKRIGERGIEAQVRLTLYMDR